VLPAIIQDNVRKLIAEEPLGHPDQSLGRLQAGLSLAQGSSHSFTRASVIASAAWLHQLRREGSATQEWAETAITLCAEQELPFFLAGATIWRGWARAVQGHVEEGIAQICQGLENYGNAGVRWGRPYFLGLLVLLNQLSLWQRGYSKALI
jgi:predicted ATPase